MVLNRLLVLMVLAIAVGMAWRYSNAEFVHDLLYPESRQSRPIVFDNGSVRDQETGPDAPGNDLVRTTPVIGLRKCVRGATVSYTDQPCPAGAREQPIARGTMTVVEGNGPAQLALGRLPQQRRKTIRDVMEVDGAELQRKLMERVAGN
jgi:hypothetical protein